MADRNLNLEVLTHTQTSANGLTRVHVRDVGFRRDILETFALWDVTWRGLVFRYRRFGTTSLPSSLRTGCPETPVNNYYPSPRNIPEERMPQAFM
jgi:hypothetical protein